jgi:hypothetical protein
MEIVFPERQYDGPTSSLVWELGTLRPRRKPWHFEPLGSSATACHARSCRKDKFIFSIAIQRRNGLRDTPKEMKLSGPTMDCSSNGELIANVSK